MIKIKNYTLFNKEIEANFGIPIIQLFFLNELLKNPVSHNVKIKIAANYNILNERIYTNF